MSLPEGQIRTKPNHSCLLCGIEGVVLYRGCCDPYFGAPGRWQFRRCPSSNCGLIWIDPLPHPDDLHLAYRRYFTHGEQDGESFRASRLRSILYQVYLLSVAIPANLVGLGQSKRERDRMFLRNLSLGKVLDVGCGDGRFLHRMQKAGWSVDGVDFDAKAVAAAKLRYGLVLRHGDLASADFPSGAYDAVTLSHVIEHVPDPIGLLVEVRRVLKQGGRMVVVTPNSESYGHREFKEHWYGLDAPRHLQIFSTRTLSETGRRAGFRVIETASTAASADIFIGASCSIRNAPGHHANPEPSPNLFRTLRAMAWQYREHFALRNDPACGEEAVLVAVKD